MDFISTIVGQILSPTIMFFVVGMFAALAGSDLKIPGGMGTAMMLFLVAAIGLKGGIGLAEVEINEVLIPALVTISLGCGIVLISYFILRKLKIDAANAASIAGHYGAVSAATMLVGFAYLERMNIAYEAFIPAFYPLMDSPAIITAILLARVVLAKQRGGMASSNFSLLLKDALLGKAVLLMFAAMVIGYISGTAGTADIMPFFRGMFKGVLCLFMLEMGLAAAKQLHDWKLVGYKLGIFALTLPLVFGTIGVALGTLAGLSIGGATMLGVFAGSASYISAPAALRSAIPEANPSLSLTASVALTFPLNVIFGVPLYFIAAQNFAKYF